MVFVCLKHEKNKIKKLETNKNVTKRYNEKNSFQNSKP